MRAAVATAVPIATAGVLALGHVGPGITWVTPLRLRWFPRLSGLGRPGHLALTFDDGPDPVGTPAILAALDRLGWRATFFVLGCMVRRAPSLAAEIVAAGHDIAVHGDVHRYLLARSPRAAADDLARATHDIAAATSVVPLWYRPPYGVLTVGGLLAARRLTLQPVLWSAWGRDWRPQATPDSVVSDLLRGVLDGGTALLHDSDVTSAPRSWRTTVAALPRLADELNRRAVRPGPLTEHWAPAC